MIALSFLASIKCLGYMEYSEEEGYIQWRDAEESASILLIMRASAYLMSLESSISYQRRPAAIMAAEVIGVVAFIV